MPRTKLTGFSRLLLFLIFFVPLAYFGASYYNGEDPIANIKGYLGMDQGSQGSSQTYEPGRDNQPVTEAPATFENVQNMRDEIARLKRELAVAEEKLSRCQTSGID
ncbi:hypothetical protein QWY85_06660 [Neolewinella lacunae]|uniref:Uncharacterized protein n=1 Tax=Neolewinella lacunae TaxID=1517758 RepID=A0A923T5R5_9BACT|nr:hypothetical protein [Neolewinella lacunae]MBC6992590.1 hypothetical protein [Neolewinella lacunae]MDN3634331.1 hypothetical protein [Neolewinella lacunae]